MALTTAVQLTSRNGDASHRRSSAMTFGRPANLS